MAKDKPPRKRLIAPDSDDEASAEAEGAPAEATKEPEEGEDLAAEEEVLEGEVDFKSVAARLRTEIAAPDDDTPVAPETFAPILEALGELKTADPLADPRLAEKAAKAKVLDALFELLEDAPRAIPPKKAPTEDSTGSNADAEGDVGGTRTAEDGADEDPDEDPSPPTEAERRAARAEAHRRAKYDALALPATRALAHLCGSHAAFRKDIGTQVVRVGTVFAALRPGRLSPAPSSDAAPAEPPPAGGTPNPDPEGGSPVEPSARISRPPQTPEDCLREATLRVLASVASASTGAAAQVARLAAGRAEALPSALPEGNSLGNSPDASARWFDACLRSADDRVVAKAARLAAVLTRTKRNRDVLFAPREARTRSEDGSEDGSEVAEEKVRSSPLASVFRAFKTSPNPAARRYCANALEAACADGGGDAGARSAYLDLEGPGFEVADALARCFLRDPDPGARVAAGNALLGVTERHRETACALGDRDWARALFQTFPNVSEAWPEVVVPPPETGDGDGGGENGEENANADEDANADEADEADEAANDEPEASLLDDDASLVSAQSSVVTVSGHNLFTDHFGVRPVGYASPPPRARPVRGFPNDSEEGLRTTPDPFFYTEDPYASDSEEHPAMPPIVVADGSHARAFPVALRLYASVLDAHAPSRRAEAGACAWPAAYLEKVGNLLVKPPNELTEADLRTPLAYLLTLLRDAAPFVAPEPPLEPPRPPPTEEERAAAEAAEAEEAEARERRRERRREDGEDTDSETEDESRIMRGDRRLPVGIALEPDSPDSETAARLDLERRTRLGERRRHEEDAKKHNAQTRAGAFAIFRALAGEPSFRDALRCAEVYPNAAERLVAAIPASHESVQEAARFLVALADGGAEGRGDDVGFEASEDLFEFGGEFADADVGGDGGVGDEKRDDDAPPDVSSSLNAKGLVRVLKRVAEALVTGSPRLDEADVRVAATMAHETALLAFRKLRLFQPKKKPMRFSSFYRTTPPKPPAPPATWRAKTTRNVDDVLPDTPEEDEANASANASDALRAAYATLEKKEKAVKILPRHVALPERWRFVDETVDADASSSAPRQLGLIALKERMRRCVEGAPAEEDARRAEAVRAAEETAVAASRAVERAERDVGAALAEKREAYAELEAAEAAARRMDEEDAIAARFAGVARATTRDERHAMTKTFEATQGERAAAAARSERARAEYASKTLAASVIASVLKKERAALAEAESSVASVRDAPETEPRGPWSVADFTDALEALSSTSADPRVGPPPCLFAGLKFVVALLIGLAEAKAAFATPPYAPEGSFSSDEKGTGDDDEKAAGKENLENSENSDGADVSAALGAPPSREALERHKTRHDASLWNDQTGVLRTALSGAGDVSLASRMTRFVNDSLWDLDPADADDAKALFLTRAYVRDAEAESALAGRVLKWAYSACTHCDVLRAKARRKEGKSRARAREK